MASTPSEQFMFRSAAAHTSWANTDNRSARTANARAAMDQKFLDQAGGDPEKAAHLRSAYYRNLAAKSAQTRRKAKEAREEAARVERERVEAFGEFDDEPDDAPNLRAMVRESIARGMRQAADGETVRRDDWLAPTLTDFLLARISEDEAAVEARGSWWPDSKMAGETVWAWRPMDERDHREATAKRRLIQEAEDQVSEYFSRFILETLASVYAEHPDYREEWKP